MEEITCGRAIGRALALGGTSHVFALTGGHVVPILDGCHQEGIRVITFRDERSAAFAAAAYGALTRQPGVCVVTAGPGLTNAITGVTQAQHGNWPVVSIAGAAEADLEGLGALQELDQEALLRPVSKWSRTIRQPDRAADAVERALRTALAAPRGHVHLSVPVDVLSRPVRWHAQQTCSGPEYVARHASHAPAEEQTVLRLLQSASRPILIAGPSLWQSGGGEGLRAFVEGSGVPAFTHEEARGLLPDSHELCMGSVIFKLNPRTRLIREADLVLAIGTDPDWRLNFLEPPFVSAEATTVLVSSDPAVRRPRSARSLVVHADEGSFLSQMMQRLQHSTRAKGENGSWTELPEFRPKGENGSWTELPEFRPKAENGSWTELPEFSEIDTAGSDVHPLEIARAVERVRHRHDVNVVFDGGNIGKWAKQQVRAERPGQWNRLKGRFGAIGHGLPSAMIRRLTDSTRQCVLVTGDGSFGYSPIELETCVRENLPVIVVVAVDGAWGSVQSGLASRLSSRKQETFTSLPQTRFDKLAIALGARGAWVESSSELNSALDEAVLIGQTTVIAVRTRTVPSPAAYPTEGY